ncbi:uncharacterized protein TRUGW13939_08938 [Talaromyces rugulosus]|uniref:Alpha/beta hydrolase fold-3 domain-containing protein n=1 Tax=Talaromyces rugulosus TaxID=121627 RepID=A0A7H8R5X3_TALRU|nr:uncharacterized protein TRUGW13939_08938 [Talaromyces rugulosus]QKX61782.1 hypothetical protein TRUGW13939_08938 [Talaromyces rugulosus]
MADISSMEDPEFSAVMKSFGPRRASPKIATALEYRATADAFIGSLLSTHPVPDNVVETKYTITSYDGAEVDIYHFIRDDGIAKKEGPQPALLYAHGGGIVACPVDTISRTLATQQASEFGVQCFAVDYRMAPEFPFPTPLEDCYAALKWLVEQSQSLNVDPKRIVLIGDSGGGTLVAGLSLLARDRGVSPPPAKQILLYPMLDDRSADIAESRPDDARSQYFSSYINMIKICWDAYLGTSTGASLNPDVQPYACPARADVLAGLPPTYIDVGSLDLFRDESLAFASKLVAANVDVEFHMYEGVPHCFDLIARDIQITRNAIENRKRAIGSI